MVVLDSRFKNWKPPKMKHGISTKWNWIPFYPHHIKIGKFTDIGALTLLFGQYGIEIGNYVQIGAGCILYSENTENNTHGKIIIREKAKIGAHSIIFPNVIIEAEERIPAKSIVYVNKKNERVIKRC